MSPAEPPPARRSSGTDVPAASSASTPSRRAKATPSMAARKRWPRPCPRPSPVHAPLAWGSKGGVRSPLRYGRNEIPPAPGGASKASPINVIPGRAEHPAGPLQGEAGVLDGRHRVEEVGHGRPKQVGTPVRVGIGLGFDGHDLAAGPHRELDAAGTQEPAAELRRRRVRGPRCHRYPGPQPEVLRDLGCEIAGRVSRKTRAGRASRSASPGPPPSRRPSRRRGGRRAGWPRRRRDLPRSPRRDETAASPSAGAPKARRSRPRAR